MGKLRNLDGEFASGALFRRPLAHAVLACTLCAVVGAGAGALAWPVLVLGRATNDYSVVAVPFLTVPAGALLGALVAAVRVARRPRP